MNQSAKSYSVSLAAPLADALERAAQDLGISTGLKLAEIVEAFFVDNENLYIDASAREDLGLLRTLRDDAVDTAKKLSSDQGFTPHITLKTFQACQADADWLRRYEEYIRGSAIAVGNPRKTYANQTIGGRIKYALRADDLTDSSGKPQRGRAPAGVIIQTYQLLTRCLCRPLWPGPKLI